MLMAACEKWEKRGRGKKSHTLIPNEKEGKNTSFFFFFNSRQKEGGKIKSRTQREEKLGTTLLRRIGKEGRK